MESHADLDYKSKYLKYKAKFNKEIKRNQEIQSTKHPAISGGSMPGYSGSIGPSSFSPSLIGGAPGDVDFLNKTDTSEEDKYKQVDDTTGVLAKLYIPNTTAVHPDTLTNLQTAPANLSQIVAFGPDAPHTYKTVFDVKVPYNILPGADELERPTVSDTHVRFRFMNCGGSLRNIHVHKVPTHILDDRHYKLIHTILNVAPITLNASKYTTGKDASYDASKSSEYDAFIAIVTKALKKLGFRKNLKYGEITPYDKTYIEAIAKIPQYMNYINNFEAEPLVELKFEFDKYPVIYSGDPDPTTADSSTLSTLQQKWKFIHYNETNLQNDTDKRQYGMLTFLERLIFQRLGYLTGDIAEYPANLLKNDTEEMQHVAIKRIRDDFDDIDFDDIYDKMKHSYILLEQESDLTKPINFSNYLTKNNIFNLWSFYLFIILKSCNDCIDATGTVETFDMSTNNIVNTSFKDVIETRSKQYMYLLAHYEAVNWAEPCTRLKNKQIVSDMFSVLINFQRFDGFEISNPSYTHNDSFITALEDDTSGDNKGTLKTNIVMIQPPPTLDPKKGGFCALGDQVGLKFARSTGRKSANNILTEVSESKGRIFSGKCAGMDIILYHDKNKPISEEEFAFKWRLHTILKTITIQTEATPVMVCIDSNWTIDNMIQAHQHIQPLPTLESTHHDLIYKKLLAILTPLNATTNKIRSIIAVYPHHVITKKRPRIGLSNPEMTNTELSPEQDGMVMLFVNIPEDKLFIYDSEKYGKIRFKL